MAYMNQEKKKALAPAIKAAMKKYGMKGSIAVRHHSTLVINIKSGALDFSDHFDGRDYIQVNPYHLDSNYSGDLHAFLTELLDAGMEGNHDHSDSMTDYFNVGWYLDINIGQWNKSYEHTGPARATEHFGGMEILEEIEITDDATGYEWAA